MPPIKGRMMGLQAAGRMSGQPPSGIDSVTRSNVGMQKRRAKFSGRGGKTTMRAVCQEELKKLRIPPTICKTLPSVKKFAKGCDTIDITDDRASLVDDSSKDCMNVVLGMRKGRGAGNRYHIKAIAEKRFVGMVWDVKFCPHSDTVEVLISCGNGVFVCDGELLLIKQLERIRLAGGIGYLSDGRIVVICRCMDVLNIYSPDGEFISDFPCGASPMGLCVTSEDELLISDPLSKEVRAYDIEGTILRTIASTGKNYHLRWPLYMDIMTNDSVVLVDCHLQNTLVFDNGGRFVRTISTRKHGGNEVLRPHGLCVTPSEDLFIIDNAVNTLEVFTLSGRYQQTLFPPEEGSKFQPKVVACSTNGYMALGSLKGHVRLFKFVSETEAKLNIKCECKSAVKVEGVVPNKIKPRPKGKLEKQRLLERKMKTSLYSEPEEDDVRIEAVITAASKQEVEEAKPQVLEIQEGDEQVTVIVLD